MIDARVEKMAEVITGYCTGVRPGDKVAIRGGTLAVPIIRALYAEVVRAGAYPLPLLGVEGARHALFEHGSDEQIQFIHDPMRRIFETYDVIINVDAAANTKAGSRLPREKVALAQRATTEILQTVLSRYEKGELRWIETIYPTQAYAQDASMSLDQYERFLFGACLPDMSDPVAYWKNLSAQQQKAVDWLQGKKRIRVEGAGVDLRMEITGRPFVNCDGKANLPDGEIYTCPVEDSIEGYVKVSYPSVYNGTEVRVVELRIERGRVSEAKAEKGEAYLLEMLGLDQGARQVGELAIGTNEGITEATGNTLLDEKIGGSFHIALGASAPDAGGSNGSALHWDLVTDLKAGGRISADGEVFYEGGKLLL